MARCRCVGTTCHCLLVAGNGITVLGTGSPDDPWAISTCVDCSSQGAPGDVMTLGPDGIWHPGPPTQVPPGSIQVGEGISGTGTVAAPLRVDLCTYGDLKTACAAP